MWLLFLACEAPDMGLSPTGLDFGAPEVGEPVDIEVQIENRGTGVLVVSEFQGRDELSVEPPGLELSEAEIGWFTVTFVGSEPGNVEDEMTIVSNDIDGPVDLTVIARVQAE